MRFTDPTPNGNMSPIIFLAKFTTGQGRLASQFSRKPAARLKEIKCGLLELFLIVGKISNLTPVTR